MRCKRDALAQLLDEARLRADGAQQRRNARSCYPTTPATIERRPIAATIVEALLHQWSRGGEGIVAINTLGSCPTISADTPPPRPHSGAPALDISMSFARADAAVGAA
eukprot:6732189-Pyramimonas_sp.AAC.1